MVKFKSHLYYEDKDKITEALKNLNTVAGSKIIFFKNGKSQGVAFENINGGAYYPAISIYKNATISVNFGPSFKYPEIREKFKCKGVSKNKTKTCEWLFLFDFLFTTIDERTSGRAYL